MVSLLWQSKHARTASVRVRAWSQGGSCVTGGFVCRRPYGTSWMAMSATTSSIPSQRTIRRMGEASFLDQTQPQRSCRIKNIEKS
jgi:hypothetical protein